MVIIRWKEGSISRSATIYEDADSYRYRAIMQKTALTLRFSLPEYIEFPVDTSIEFEGKEYKTKDVASFKKEGERRFKYTLTFYDETADLEKYKLLDTIDRRVRFSRCAKPKEYIDLIVANLNQREPGWKVGSVIDAAEKTIAFDHTNVLEALQKVADEFCTEWEIEAKTVSLRKVEYFKEDPLPLSYGKGNGFVPGVGRTAQEDEKPVEILFVQGGERNIDRSKYGSKYLLLPKSKEYTYEGRIYVTDADGFSIRRKDKNLSTGQEDSLDLSDIYPSRVGEVTEVFEVDKEKNYYDFTDKTIPSELDYNACLIEGESMTISFLTGMLAGDDKQFECKYNHEQRRWQLVPQEIDGITMPGGNYIPRATDTYAVFGIQLPDSYICNDTDKTGASWEMMKEACRHLYDKETPKFTFTGELQGLWAKKNWMRIGGRMRCGSYILFSDTQFVPDGVAIRITGIKDYLSSPKTPIIELSNTVSGSSISSEIDKIKDKDIIIEDEIGKAVSFTKRRFRDALETMDMLEGAMLENFTNRISPIAIETMAMLVGDESLQFRFVNTSLSQVYPNFAYSAATRQMTCPASILQHLTLGVKDITSDKGRDAKKYKKWSLPLYVSPVLTDAKAKFYLYAKCSTTAETGEYILSQAAHKLQEGTNYYFLVGILNSEYDGERSFVTMYGFTEILPGRITTDRVVTPDASSFFDLVANAFKLGDALSFNIDGDRKLRLKGTLVQSNSGQESFIGCYRGKYDPNATYYAGDEVTFMDETRLVSSYRYILETPSKGVAPTNEAYWEITARGSRGEDGEPGQNGADGVDGQDGKDGDSPACVYRGNYDDGADYYGTPYRVDVVKAGSKYYVARTDAGAPFNRVAPPNSLYWQDFGAQFDSIATGLLLAEGANIANFIFANQRMESQGKTNGTPNIILDGRNNLAQFASGKVRFDRDLAKIAWLEIVGNDIVGYDEERNVRLRISNTALPSVNSLSTTVYLDCSVGTDSDAIYDDQYGEVTRPGWREEIRDEWEGTRVDEQCTINTDLTFTIDQDNTMVSLDFQAGIHASIRDLTIDESISIYEVPGNRMVATTDTARLTTKLNKGKYRARLYARFNSQTDWRADMSMQFRPPMVTKWAQQTYIGNDGILVTGGGNYLKQSNDVFEVSVGNNGIKITSTSAQKQINGSWMNL